jgi:hypothetical protein
MKDCRGDLGNERGTFAPVNGGSSGVKHDFDPESMIDAS